MGDFSRDTFKLTNAMHSVLSGETVADPRHYVGVRLQQGVPLLDSDWNELEDIRREELILLVKSFIGTGVPSGNEGFRIAASGDPNNFVIHPGLMLGGGLLAINLNLTTYNGQPSAVGLPALTTPPGGPDRLDVVYLDVWHEETTGEGTGADNRLVNPAIGVETSVRSARKWRVRVRENAADLSGLPVPDGHAFTALAQLRRRAGASLIGESSILDRRRRGITVAEHLKVPLDLQRGSHQVDSDRFAQMMKNFRLALFSRWANGQLPHASATPAAEALLLAALQQLAYFAQSCEVQSLSRSVDESDALRLLQELYANHKSWLQTLALSGNQGNSAQAFIDDYGHYLDGQAGTAITGLKPPLDLGDVISAVLAQEQLNTFLANAVNSQIEGVVSVVYKSVDNFAPMEAGQTYVFSYDVTASFVSPNPAEPFQIQVTLPADFGTAVPDQASLTFSAPSETKTLKVTVQPTGAALSADLDVRAVAQGDPSLHSTQPPLTLNRSQEPPAASFYFYIGPPLDDDGLHIPVTHLTRPQGRLIPFRLKNAGTTDILTYQVTRQILPDVASNTGWDPTTAASLAPIVLNAGTQSDVGIRVDGPKSPAPAPAVGTTGHILTTAVVTLVNGAAPAEAQTPVTVSIPFIVTA